jgi:hypothetical protein
VQLIFHAYRLQANGISQGFSRAIEMKILTWKEVLTTLNPSPIFGAVANFAEVLAMNGDGLYPKESDRRKERGCQTGQH